MLVQCVRIPPRFGIVLAAGRIPRGGCMSPVRVAVLSDDGLLCEHFVRIAGADASLQIVGQDQRAVLPPPLRAARPDVLFVDGRLEGALDLCKALKNEAGPAVLLPGGRDE